MQCPAKLAPPPRQYWEAAAAKAGVELISRAVLPVKAIPKQVPPQLPATVAAALKPDGAPPIQEAVPRTVPVKAPPQVAAAEAASSSMAARYKSPSASGSSSSQGAGVQSERIVLPLPAKAPEAIARSSASRRGRQLNGEHGGQVAKHGSQVAERRSPRPSRPPKKRRADAGDGLSPRPVPLGRGTSAQPPGSATGTVGPLRGSNLTPLGLGTSAQLPGGATGSVGPLREPNQGGASGRPAARSASRWWIAGAELDRGPAR